MRSDGRDGSAFPAKSAADWLVTVPEVTAYTAVTLHLGWLPSGLMFTAVITVSVVARLQLGLNAIVGFWVASVLTRQSLATIEPG